MSLQFIKRDQRKNLVITDPYVSRQFPSKFFELNIVDSIVDHWEKNKLLLDSQNGFRHKRSCLSNMLKFFHNMFRIYDSSRVIDIIYLDFQKAFDKVPHKKLMA